MFSLEGQLAIITGGARGIGEGVSRIFCKAGATVIIWDINEDGKETAERISEDGGHIFFNKVNITSRTDVDAAVAEIIKDHGRIDILVNNAGIIRDKSFMKMTDEEWQSVIEVNMTGTFNCTKAVIPHMKHAGYGRIISASSINASVGAFGQTNYAATKAAISGFTRSLCREVGKYGITVNAVAPGFIETKMTRTMPEPLINAAIAQIPLKRIGTVEDMGYVYLFLASRESEFVNGITLHANGGALPL